MMMMTTTTTTMMMMMMMMVTLQSSFPSLSLSSLQAPCSTEFCGNNRTSWWFSGGYWGTHADVIAHIFAHLHRALRTEGSMLEMN